MGTKTSCDYCDKVKENEQHFINVHIESSSALILSIDLCSDECLEKTLNLGSKILDFGCVPEKPYKKLIQVKKK